ncbi:hypothetical protein [Nodularia sphaerocarpa]|nr:hypothetical protein [Nodularia sphaerocarpa]MDB9376130.1 hypothetical protein [Nodularia sphaerocarpa CS-585]ULP73421.1 hypothetical protein BDGGKGIB_03074 [Nodularia sphaerocarpa UHCC 0038]
MSEEKDKKTKSEETKYCPSTVTIPGKTVKERADKFRDRFKR